MLKNNIDSISAYEKELEEHLVLLEGLKKKNIRFGLLRLLVALLTIGALYQWHSTNMLWYIIPTVIFLSLFLFLVKKHQRIQQGQKLEEELVEINKKELQFLEKNHFPFDNGKQFIDPNHTYSYDLDLFGEHSLYQYLNRTSTNMGGLDLASKLKSSPVVESIEDTQKAVKELSKELPWRQKLFALGRTQNDSATSYEQLLDWAQSPQKNIVSIVNTYSYIAPFATITLAILYFTNPSGVIGNYALLIFLLNLVLLGPFIPAIKNENKQSTEVDKILRQYAKIIAQIENKSFESPKLSSLQNNLIEGKKKASRCVNELSSLFTRLDHINNVFAAPLLNGIGLFHIHVFRGLNKWKKENASQLKLWLNTIGEFESLNSLANFSYNNPDFGFPKIESNREIILNDAGHPMISPKKRVTNDISFKENKFFVLTGSNMSGKSTFLRSLGINMVLTNIGSVVCASSASIHPMEIFVSMRLADSLSDSESYFFAEVKRLKEIIEALDKKTGFVLLDEILRGTNSDDKRVGTIEVVRKIHKLDGIGIIATHDLEVCNVSNELSGVTNKRFEVAIKEDELEFNYKLLDGVCENKSATFLMRKMGVIH